MKDTELVAEVFKRADDYFEKQKKICAITELEKTKADLQKMVDDEWNQQVGADKGLELAIEVIEDRISELKGENNNG